jgi:ketosteroid isomerase-like protein
MAWVVAAGTATGLVAALLWMWLEARGASDPGRFRAAEHFSFERYAVMERLFSAEDLEYLRTQPGATPELAAKWRRESVAVFRAYLAELTRDFHALHAHARHMVAGSRSDSAELAATLVRQQGEFLRARVALEVRLVLFQFGIGKVDAAPLLALLGAMQSDLGRLVPEAAASV